MDAENMLKIAYGRYQVHWLLAHGHTLEELVKEVNDVANEMTGEPGSLADLVFHAFQEWESDVGFGGEIYACMDEFAENEYRDEKYMELLLSDTEFAIWSKLQPETKQARKAGN